MTAPRPTGRPIVERSDLAPLALLVVLSAVLHVGTAWSAARAADLSLSAFGVFFDGHLYLEIARSFPLPFAPEGLDYLGQAPGYPALAALIRALTPDAAVNWGLALLLGAWLPAVLCTLVFYLVCKQVDLAAFWPAALFVVANPRWVSIAASAHPEPLAMLFALGCLLALLRGHLGLCAALLAGAILTRYPALLLGLPIAFGAIVSRRDWRPRTFAILLTPLVPFALVNLYLSLRVPHFPGILSAHSIFWNTAPDWPFAELYRAAARWLWASAYPIFELTYGSVVFYVAAMVAGFRRAERELWLLPIWIAALVLFHVSLSGVLGAWDFTRLAVLAWPAALLVFWRLVVAWVPAWAAAALCIACAAFSLSFTSRQMQDAIAWQKAGQTFLPTKIDQLDSDTPDWIDFRRIVREQRANETRESPPGP
jgi:hypothetical protein